MKPSDQFIEYNQKNNNRQRQANVKTCLWTVPNLGDCDSDIVDAHSIQRGKILTKIADKGMIYQLKPCVTDDLTEIPATFVKEGIKKFSTFNGFCKTHDKEIFKPIEDKSFVATNTTQLDIYAYRAAAKELHTNLVSTNLTSQLLEGKHYDLPPHYNIFMKPMLNGNVKVPDFIRDDMVNTFLKSMVSNRTKQTQLSVKELRNICDHLQDVIVGGAAPLHEHAYYSFDHAYPLACSGCFIPYKDYLGNSLYTNKVIEQLAKGVPANIADTKFVFINIFPENEKTHVIFTYFKGNSAFKASIEKLVNLQPLEIKKHLSSLLLNYVENMGFNPTYMETKFTEEEQIEIKKIFEGNILQGDSFYKNKISLFRE